MSDLNNPLFDNQREFLERQKEEYRNALIGDVAQIKNQGQEIGKKVAMAGGVILAGYLLKRAFTSDKKKARKVTNDLKGKETKVAVGTIPVSHPIPNYDPISHRTVTDFTAGPAATSAFDKKKAEKAIKQQKRKTGPGLAQKLMQSNFARMMAMEGVALLVAYITKKAADRMQSNAENNDIAAKAAPATVADPVVQSASQKHAI
ncbi:hypothetical protein WG947_11410 [Pontibacter sp. H259]|uniref:hypothetical protein n=1 Tax=Pontibacter sp. H259 TaxID=3133421 RepID=UPI0030BE36DF